MSTDSDSRSDTIGASIFAIRLFVLLGNSGAADAFVHGRTLYGEFLLIVAGVVTLGGGVAIAYGLRKVKRH